MFKAYKKIKYLLLIISVLIAASLVIVIIINLTPLDIEKDNKHIEYKTFEQTKEEIINNQIPEDIQKTIRSYLDEVWVKHKSYISTRSELYYSRMDITFNSLYVELTEYREAEYADGGSSMQSICEPHYIILEKDSSDNWFVSDFDDGCNLTNIHLRNRDN